MVITLLPTVALATNAVSVWVGGVELTYKDAPIYAIMSGNTMTTDDADQNNYNVKFEVVDSVSTLTLHDFAYTGSGYEDVGLYASLYAAGDLSIVLEGANSVTQRGGKRGYSYCIYSLGMLSISGSGSLTANGGEANDHSYGIYSADGISIIGGTVTADGGEAIAHSYGIYSDKDITVSGGTVTANGGETNSYSYGIYSAGGAITVSGGTVTANGGKAGGGSCGVYSSEDIFISGGTVTAEGGVANLSQAMNKVPAATGDTIKAGTNSENATDDTYSNQKWVNISFCAQVSDFIITGTVGTDITPVTAKIILDGVTFASTVNPGTIFDTNVAGISAQVTEVNSEKEVTVVISSHGENCGEGNMRVNLQSGTVTDTTRAFDTATSARAKYEIKTNKIIKRTTVLNFTYNPVTYQNIYGEDKSVNPQTTNITDTARAGHGILQLPMATKQKTLSSVVQPSALTTILVILAH